MTDPSQHDISLECGDVTAAGDVPNTATSLAPSPTTPDPVPALGWNYCSAKELVAALQT